MKNLLTIWLLIFTTHVVGQSTAEEHIARGNEYYKQKQYGQAISEYDRALQINPNNSIAKFNMANALYMQGKRTEAMRVYTDVTNTARENSFRSTNYYNKGVVYTRQKKLEESIEEYKQSLRLNPDDRQARENLQKALLELKKKNQQQQNQQQKKQEQSSSKLNPRQADQRLKQLNEKEKETQEKVQQSKNKTTGGTGKDW